MDISSQGQQCGEIPIVDCQGFIVGKTGASGKFFTLVDGPPLTCPLGHLAGLPRSRYCQSCCGHTGWVGDTQAF